MGRTVTISNARATLPEIIERVSAGEEVTLTRHGTPVAVIVRPDRLRSRRADEAFATAERILDLIHEGRHRPLTTVEMPREELEAWIAEIDGDDERP